MEYCNVLWQNGALFSKITLSGNDFINFWKNSDKLRTSYFPHKNKQTVIAFNIWGDPNNTVRHNTLMPIKAFFHSLLLPLMFSSEHHLLNRFRDRSGTSTRHGAIWKAFKAGNGPVNAAADQRNTQRGHNLCYNRFGTFCSEWVWLTFRRWNWEPRAMSQRVQHRQTAEDITRAHPRTLGEHVLVKKKKKKKLLNPDEKKGKTRWNEGRWQTDTKHQRMAGLDLVVDLFWATCQSSRPLEWAKYSDLQLSEAAFP